MHREFSGGYRALYWQAQPGGTTYGFTLHLCYRPYSTTRFTSDARKPKIQVAFFNKNFSTKTFYTQYITSRPTSFQYYVHSVF